MTISFDAPELYVLAVDLASAGAKATLAVGAAVQLHGKLIETTWRSNAVVTSGAHGIHYPKSIKATTISPLEVEIAPDPGMPQGGMSFEFGSSNQPPHLDGQRALDTVTPKFLSAVETAATGVL